MAEQSKFPEKLFCNLVVEGDGRDIWAYEDLETAAIAPAEDETNGPVKVGVYTLTEVVEARLISTVETTKVEG